MTDFLAFTMKYGFRVSKLTTPCGIALPGKANDEESRIFDLEGVWDTGASITTISERAVSALGLEPNDTTGVNTVGEIIERNLFKIDLLLPSGIAIPNLQVMDGKLLKCDVLVGMDVIGLGDLAIPNLNGETALSFKIPSDEEIDFTHTERAKSKKAVFWHLSEQQQSHTKSTVIGIEHT